MSADIFLAAKIGDTEWLVQSLTSPSHANRYDKSGYAPIHWAAVNGRLNCLRILIETYQVDPNLPTLDGWYALHLCINKNNGDRALQCAKYLVKCGADVTNTTNQENISVLHQAASAGLLDCVQFLLDFDAPLHEYNSDGHTAYDVARLWGNRACARFILDAIWKQDKLDVQSESKKLKLLRSRVCQLQKTAVHQLQNERDFFSDITFDNWMEDKGYFDYPLKTFKVGNSVDGLYKRLGANGSIDDCAKKMERLSHQFSTKKRNHRDKRGSMYPAKSKLDGAHRRFRSKNKPEYPLKPVTPATGKTLPMRKMWNYSTNVNSLPCTNIKQPVLLSLGVNPDEEKHKLLPLDANLPVQVEKAPSGLPSVKLMLPGGEVQSNAVEIPRLPPSIVWRALSRPDKERFQAPEGFKPVHIADVHHKRRVENPPYEEIAHHLAVTLKISDNISTPSTLPSEIKNSS
uniref:Ankyrin repeat domain-containing protein 53 n=1 Tax=Phallusia mammillata TaxID=59560 RepID=A0A6F9D7A3_9ASCI|nr:ankyrin repeat domain-containing protein 53 [Phallusia mammillata]